MLTHAIALLALLALAGCDPSRAPSPSVGSNSNWLRACTADKECDSAPSCLCGACTAECSDDSDCSMLVNARCVFDLDPATAPCQTAGPGMGSGTGSGLCLPRCQPGGCRDGQACVAQACVLAPLPDNAFCQAAAHPAATARTLEDALLALLQEKRTSGSFSCNGGAALPAAPALHFDPRLLCETRVFAADVAVTHARSVVDSQGRKSDERMRLAGYTPRLWSESFATGATSAEAALQTILSDDSGACMRFADPSYTDVGVGSAAGVEVITLGAEN